MNTGEDTTGLRKIMDLTRWISLFVLGIHFYLCCYGFFRHLGFHADLSDRILKGIAKTALFRSIYYPKIASLLFLLISLLGVKGGKNEHIRLRPLIVQFLMGIVLFFASVILLYLEANLVMKSVFYMVVALTGYLFMMASGAKLSRIVKESLQGDIFNRDNETFPQEERLLENEFSVNLPAQYRHKGELKRSWINLVNMFRGLLVVGTPGAGKSYFVIRHIIAQHIKKGFSMFIYDFKYDDLSRIAWNMLRKFAANYAVRPKFFVINFDDPLHRCNPLDPEGMEDITDATEASRTIMLGLNRDWIKKQGDFFVESPINFLTAMIWYLRKYMDGVYCTLPHVIELMQADYDQLFTLLEKQEEIKVLINPFITAWKNDALPQLEGQIASAKIGLARLSSPQLYYVLSGNDFTLDLNNPKAPKIICVGNNPQKIQIYGAVLSLYVSRMIKLVNQKNKLKSSLIFDEFPTIYFNNMDSLIATARSNKVATTLAIQDFSQLRKDYGQEQADVITGIVGNIISGQVTGDTAKKLSETFGKIMQDRQSKSVNSSDVSISKSTQLEMAIPASKIASLSSGEFVGMVADNPQEKIALKMFHCEILNDHAKIAEEEAGFEDIPNVARVSEADIRINYERIKAEVAKIIATEGIINGSEDTPVKKKKKKKGNAKGKPSQDISQRLST
ncbi:conjugal transfer protein TraG [Pedobacter sp. KBW01]|uniref:conjugal transfer protein MobC n=1 Tax=Pedobacter sp. KBW01 TaxID=2153364 RepID=UPI000F594EF6|nr:conjugal transfer protein MobC [Pedobacter sp. KBW01]RQO77814.1 conjugal transfer protein TraG [Pedobacter sp. KBW01]